MYNPTHRFDTSAQTAPTSDPSVGWSHEFQSRVYEAAVWGGSVYLAVGESIVRLGQDGTGRWRFTADKKVKSSPAVVGGTVFVGSQDNHVYALDADSGRKEWAFETGAAVISSPAVVDGTVFVGSRDNHVYALDAAIGSKQWAFETDGWVISSPAVVDGTVFVGNNDWEVYALEGADRSGTQIYERCSQCGGSLSAYADTGMPQFCPECGAETSENRNTDTEIYDP